MAAQGIFMPGFVLVPFLYRIVRLVHERKWARAFLDGVNVAALGLIAAVAVQLARTAFVDPLTIVIALVSLAVLRRLPLTSPPLVLAGGCHRTYRNALITTIPSPTRPASPRAPHAARTSKRPFSWHEDLRFPAVIAY